MSRKYTAGQFAPANGGIVDSHANLSLLGYFAGTPTAGMPGWEVGGIAVDVTNGIIYCNATGTTSSAIWTAVGGGASASINGSTGAQGGAVTLTGGTSTTSANAGGAVTAVGGTPGATGVGGAINLTGGAGGATSGAGGAVVITGGAGTAGNATGGAASLIGGAGQGSAAGGAITITSGAAGATGVAGAVNISVGAATAGAGSNVTITGGNGAGGTAAGGNVNLVPGTAVSTGTPGEFQVNGNSAVECSSFNYTASLVTQTVFTATRAVRVKAILGRVRVQGTGGACTIQFFKCGSGTAVGSGTALDNSSTFNLVGTVDTNQSITLSSTVATVTLAAGDSIGYVLTGTATSAVGSITIHVVPV